MEFYVWIRFVIRHGDHKCLSSYKQNWIPTDFRVPQYVDFW